MEAKIILVSSLKGGVGKSKLTAAFGMHLAINQGLDVCIIDADIDQQTLTRFRSVEIDNLVVVPWDPQEYKHPYEMAHSMQEDFHFIFIDLPGSMQQDGVIKSIENSDIIIIPTDFSDENIDSTNIFTNLLDKLKIENYLVVFNNYEVQYDIEIRKLEDNLFSNVNKLSTKKIIPYGIRKERAALQSAFVIGEWKHRKEKKLNVSIEKILEYIDDKLN